VPFLCRFNRKENPECKTKFDLDFCSERSWKIRVPSGRFRVEIQTFDSVAYFYNNIKVNKKAIFGEWAKLQLKTHSLVSNSDFFNQRRSTTRTTSSASPRAARPSARAPGPA